MYFLEPLSLRYANLSNEQNHLLSATEYTIFLHAINVRNDSEEDNIRINFHIHNPLNTSSGYSHIMKNTLLEPNESQNLLTLRGKADLRPIFLTPGESLFCYSNGYNQLFDCNISYSVSNEEVCRKKQ